MKKINQLTKFLKIVTRAGGLIFSFAFWLLKKLRFILALVLERFLGNLKKRLRFSITFKTAVMYTLLLSTVFFLLSLIFTSSFVLLLTHESERNLRKNVELTQRLLAHNKSHIPGTILKEFADIEGIKITLFNKERDILYTTGDKDDVTFYVNEETSPAKILFNNYDYLQVPTDQNITQKIYYIQLSKPLLEEKLYLSMLLVILFLSFLLALAITIIVGSRTLKKMLKPISNMIKTTRSISVEDLHTRLDAVNSYDELKELAETFNEMLDRIQASYEQQQQFVSDASHELRTPIAVIQGYANLLQRWGKEDKAVLDESICALQGEAQNMKNLVEKLLFLARTDKNTQKLDKSFFAVNELIDEVIKETILITSQHKINCEANEHVTIHGDRALIKQSLRVFIDNSIKYTPDQGVITISSFRKDSFLVFSIEDTGIGISEQDLPKIFNRFYKCDKSRTRDNGGTGLGLSIAKWIIEKHGGTIKVYSQLTKGSQFIISLPI